MPANKTSPAAGARRAILAYLRHRLARGILEVERPELIMVVEHAGLFTDGERRAADDVAFRSVLRGLMDEGHLLPRPFESATWDPDPPFFWLVTSPRPTNVGEDREHSPPKTGRCKDPMLPRIAEFVRQLKDAEKSREEIAAAVAKKYGKHLAPDTLMKYASRY